MNLEIAKIQSKKKILYVHTHGALSGAAHSLITLIRHLDREKFRIYVFCPKGKAYDAFQKVSDEIYDIPSMPEIITISGYSFNYLRLLYSVILLPNLQKIMSRVMELNPDLIHLNEISLTPLARKLKSKNFKVVMHARLVLNHNTRLLNNFIVKRLKKYADHIICIDGSVEAFLKKTGKTSVVYNSYQFSKEELVSEKGHADQKFVVLFLANLMTKKGVFDLVEAAKDLRQIKDLEIWIAGTNSRPDVFFKSLKGKLLSLFGVVADNRKKIEKLIANHQLDNVKLLGHVQKVNEIVRQASVLIFPSYMNGPSRSIFEAGVFGIPSIISLHDKREDVVEDNITGLIIDEKRPDQIKDAILKVYKDKQFCHNIGSNARMKYLTLNNPVLNNKKIEKIYSDLLVAEKIISN